MATLTLQNRKTISFWNWLTRPHESIKDIEAQRQSKLLAMLALALLAGGILGVFSITMNVVRLGAPSIQILMISPVPLVALVSFYLNRQGHYSSASYSMIVMLIAVVTIGWKVTGVIVLLFYFISVLFISAALLKPKATAIVTLVSLSILVYYMTQLGGVGTMVIPAQGPVVFLLFNAPLMYMYIRHRNQLEEARQQELQRYNVQLQESETTLEKRVAARTRDLAIAADVSKQITTILDVEALLKAIVERTKDGFRLYYASVFLFDDVSNTLTMEAGTGEVGTLLKASGKQFAIDGDNGLIPTTARTRQPVIVNDVTKDARYFANPQLPGTRSELALPIVIGDTLIGVLDCQSEDINRFSSEDVRIMTTLADQIAVAVNNAQLYAQQVGFTEQLREVDNLKSHFLASMSHELRTPLNAVINFTRFVSDGVLGPVTSEQVETLGKVLASGKHLLALINDVLDITKIESGMLSLFVEANVNLPLELEHTVATAETLLSEKSEVTLVKDIAPELPLLIGDKRRIRQILLNLVSNACKFTEHGSITISAHVQGANVLMSVKDTGAGIAPEDQELIFEPFRQTEVGLSQGGGTGLGLAIARKLAEAHGGKLWLESTVGVGSSFFLSLPIESEILKDKVVVLKRK